MHTAWRKSIPAAVQRTRFGRDHSPGRSCIDGDVAVPRSAGRASARRHRASGPGRNPMQRRLRPLR